MVKINDKKCAPGIKYEDGSCFNKETLVEMINEYNLKSSEKIIIDNNFSKKEIVEKFQDIFNPKCLDQLCWINQIKLNGIKKEQILKETFRPFGPNGLFDWLSTTDINDVLEQYQNVHKDFLFLGAVPYDFEDLKVLNIGDIKFKNIENQGKYKIGMVINLDESHQSGSHWVALYTNLLKNQVYFFDSVGKPPGYRIKKFINKITKYLYKKNYKKNLSINKIFKGENSNYHLSNLLNFDINYNNIQHQKKNTECGVYSTNFIIRLLEGDDFLDIINNITRDEKMNEYRKEIFINVN
jgi:hypothetical protein